MPVPACTRVPVYINNQPQATVCNGFPMQWPTAVAVSRIQGQPMSAPTNQNIQTASQMPSQPQMNHMLNFAANGSPSVHSRLHRPTPQELELQQQYLQARNQAAMARAAAVMPPAMHAMPGVAPAQNTMQSQSTTAMPQQVE